MLFAEPARSKYDLSFKLGRMPVRIHPGFWIITVLFAIGGPSTPLTIGVWVGAVFISILVHELGHAVLMRRFGLSPHIVLHGMGGLAVPDHGFRSQSRLERILISFAGPGAGFLFALAIVGVVAASGHQASLFGFAIGPGAPLTDPTLRLVLSDLLYINVGWGLVNLVPVHPLDGGHISEELFGYLDPSHATRRSLWLSVFAGAAMAAVGLFYFGSSFTGFFFAYLAYLSYASIQRHRGQLPPSGRRLWSDLKSRWARTRRKVEHKIVETAAKQSMKSQVEIEERALANPRIEKEARGMLDELAKEARKARQNKAPSQNEPEER